MSILFTYKTQSIYLKKNERIVTFVFRNPLPFVVREFLKETIQTGKKRKRIPEPVFVADVVQADGAPTRIRTRV